MGVDLEIFVKYTQPFMPNLMIPLLIIPMIAVFILGDTAQWARLAILRGLSCPFLSVI